MGRLKGRQTGSRSNFQQQPSSDRFILSVLVPRIEDYSHNNDYRHVDKVVEYLNHNYREYRRHKQGPFRQVVQRAIQAISRKRADKSAAEDRLQQREKRHLERRTSDASNHEPALGDEEEGDESDDDEEEEDGSSGDGGRIWRGQTTEPDSDEEDEDIAIQGLDEADILEAARSPGQGLNLLNSSLRMAYDKRPSLRLEQSPASTSGQTPTLTLTSPPSAEPPSRHAANNSLVQRTLSSPALNPAVNPESPLAGSTLRSTPGPKHLERLINPQSHGREGLRQGADKTNRVLSQSPNQGRSASASPCQDTSLRTRVQGQYQSGAEPESDPKPAFAPPRVIAAAAAAAKALGKKQRSDGGMGRESITKDQPTRFGERETAGAANSVGLARDQSGLEAGTEGQGPGSGGGADGWGDGAHRELAGEGTNLESVLNKVDDVGVLEGRGGCNEEGIEGDLGGTTKGMGGGRGGGMGGGMVKVRERERSGLGEVRNGGREFGGIIGSEGEPSLPGGSLSAKVQKVGGKRPRERDDSFVPRSDFLDADETQEGKGAGKGVDRAVQHRTKRMRRNEDGPSRAHRQRDEGDETGVSASALTQPRQVRFKDFGGIEGTLHAIRELIEYPLAHPELYQWLGVEPPRGVLLHGPPGCGKTMLAHAIAVETGVPFLKISAPEVVSGMSGESEAKIRSLFADAVRLAPCIVFIDEIDAITPKRETAQREMERRIVAQLLTCMDDLNQPISAFPDEDESGAKNGHGEGPMRRGHVVVIGATNRPDSLDAALRRAGRFDREIALGIPDEDARARILEVLSRRLRLEGSFNFKQIARRTPGFVGADLQALTKEAAAIAVKRIFSRFDPSPEPELKASETWTSKQGLEASGARSSLTFNPELSNDDREAPRSRARSGPDAVAMDEGTGLEADGINTNTNSKAGDSARMSSDPNPNSHPNFGHNPNTNHNGSLSRTANQALPEAASLADRPHPARSSASGEGGSGVGLQSGQEASLARKPRLGSDPQANEKPGDDEAAVGDRGRVRVRVGDSGTKPGSQERGQQRTAVPSAEYLARDRVGREGVDAALNDEVCGQEMDDERGQSGREGGGNLATILRQDREEGTWEGEADHEEGKKEGEGQGRNRDRTNHHGFISKEPGGALMVVEDRRGLVQGEGGRRDGKNGGQEDGVVLRDDDLWKRPWTAGEMESLRITMEDFEAAIAKVQPSAKREGFATIPDVTWEDVGALGEVREELEFSISRPIKHPEDYQAMGLDMAVGVLLFGPPGCGKTLVAKAIAADAGANFISIKGPELLNKFVGESERAVRQLFSRARASAPCVLFFDEMDAMAPRRGSDGNQAAERVVNQLLTEMDGLDSRKSIFLIAATNRPDMIDSALLRPGRLDKLLYVPLPTPPERASIIATLMRNTPLAPGVDAAALARSDNCAGFSGADLAALVREACIAALRERSGPGTTPHGGPPLVEARHFEAALERVLPSVSAKDVKRYESMRHKLRRARGNLGKVKAPKEGSAEPSNVDADGA